MHMHSEQLDFCLVNYLGTQEPHFTPIVKQFSIDLKNLISNDKLSISCQ